MTTKKTTTKKAPAKSTKAATPKQKVYKKTASKVQPVRTSASVFQIKNKTYDILKALATIVLPAIAALYITLASIWGFGLAHEVNATIEAVICFINALLGLFLNQSSKAYHKGD